MPFSLLDAPLAPGGVGGQQHLGVAGRPPSVVGLQRRNQLGPQVAEVVDLAVEHEPSYRPSVNGCMARGSGSRMASRRKARATCGWSGVIGLVLSGQVDTLAVGAAVGDGGAHPASVSGDTRYRSSHTTTPAKPHIPSLPCGCDVGSCELGVGRPSDRVYRRAPLAVGERQTAAPTLNDPTNPQLEKHNSQPRNFSLTPSIATISSQEELRILASRSILGNKGRR